MIARTVPMKERLGKRCYLVMQILGWLVLAGVVVRVLHGWPGLSSDVSAEVRDYFRATWVSSTLMYLLAGVLGLGVGQFVRYVSDETYRGGRLLRHGDKVLYAQAALLAVHRLVARILYLRTIAGDAGLWSFFGGDAWTQFALPALRTAIYVLVLVAFGMILPRVVRIIGDLRSPVPEVAT